MKSTIISTIALFSLSAFAMPQIQPQGYQPGQPQGYPGGWRVPGGEHASPGGWGGDHHHHRPKPSHASVHPSGVGSTPPIATGVPYHGGASPRPHYTGGAQPAAGQPAADAAGQPSAAPAPTS